MPEQQTPDFRQLITEYIGGQHRPTRHVDVCLDPDLAAKLDAARDARDAAQLDLDTAKDAKTATMGNAPAQAAKKALDKAEKELAELTETARGCSVRIVFMGLDSTGYAAFGAESRAKGREASAGIADTHEREEEAGRAQFTWESSELPSRTLHAVTTVDGKPTDITVDQGRELLAVLGTGDTQRCYLAAVDACVTSVDLPF